MSDETTHAALPKIGRNDPCWCGSGRKYKKCHWDFDQRLHNLALAGEVVPDHDLLKTADDIAAIKRSAEVNIAVLDGVAERIRAGVSTETIDEWVAEITAKGDAICATLGYEGYPKSVCTSINDVVCHGIPSPDDVLVEGDIINVDCSTIKDGYFSDSSRMFCIGEVSEERRRLVETTRAAMMAGLEAAEPWGHLGDIGAAVFDYATERGFSVVREFGGHGIGHEFHEDPFVSFVARRGTGMVLAPGLVFTIEPMINAGAAPIDMSDPNGWTVRTADHSDSAQWEIQVAITEDGVDVLCW